MPTIGVLAFQGDFACHIATLDRMGASHISVRDPRLLDQCDGLIIPGGESTTIGMLMDRFGLIDELVPRIKSGFPVFGTCAGAILLADTIEDSDQPRLGGLPVSVRRNAYGRQVDSFDSDLQATPEGDKAGLADPPVHGVFIRAPIITRVHADVTCYLEHNGNPVALRHNNILVATFHPELTDDLRVHRHFVETMVMSRE